MLRLTFGLLFVAIGTAPSAPQPDRCAPVERRTAAIRYARQINTMEAAAFRLQRSYQSLEQLPAEPLPADYDVQLPTDGTAYALSIKDKTDACHGIVFSDQNGVIYTGLPIQ